MTSLDKFKLQAVTWDSDKDSDPSSFQKWAEDFSSIVRATEHGAPLEDLIDAKVGRQILQPLAVPSYLKDDPDFATFIELQTEAAAAMDEFYTSGSTASPGAQAEDTTATPSVAPSGFSLGKSKLPYHLLDEKTIALDHMLYNVIQQVLIIMLWGGTL